MRVRGQERALVEFAVPLRAMRAFYGVRYLREALPDWAANEDRKAHV